MALQLPPTAKASSPHGSAAQAGSLQFLSRSLHVRPAVQLHLKVLRDPGASLQLSGRVLWRMLQGLLMHVVAAGK